MLGVRASSWAALAIALILGFSVSAEADIGVARVEILPGPSDKGFTQLQLPPHVQVCMHQMQYIQYVMTLRLAGATREEMIVTLDVSKKLIEYGRTKGMTVTDADERMLRLSEGFVNEVYDMTEEQFSSSAYLQTWASETMQSCIDELAPKPGA